MRTGHEMKFAVRSFMVALVFFFFFFTLALRLGLLCSRWRGGEVSVLVWSVVGMVGEERWNFVRLTKYLFIELFSF